MECGQGRPIVSNIKTYSLTYNEGTLRIDEIADDGGSTAMWDISAVTDQQHSDSATFSAPLTQRSGRSWVTVNTEGQLIGGGYHGLTDASYVHCGVALDGLERAPDIAASFPSTSFRCHNSIPSGVRFDKFGYAVFAMNNRIVTRQDTSSSFSSGWANFNDDYLVEVNNNQIAYYQIVDSNTPPTERVLRVDAENQNIVGTYTTGRAHASSSRSETCGELALGVKGRGTELISKLIDPALVARSSAEMQCDRNGSTFIASVTVGPETLLIRATGEPSVGLPMSGETDLPMTVRREANGALTHYRYRNQTTWITTQLGGQLTEAIVFKAEFGETVTLTCRAN